MKLRLIAAVVLVSLLCWASKASAAIEVVRTVEIGDYSVKVLRDQTGWLVDVGNAKGLRPEDYLQYFSGTKDITASVRNAPPLVEFIYSFAGVSVKDQCVYKSALDAMLSPIGAPFPAYAGGSDDLCDGLGVNPAARLPADRAGWTSYSRILLIEVVGDTKAERPTLPPQMLHAKLSVSPGEFANPSTLFGRVKPFFETNANGIFNFFDPALVGGGVPVEGRIFRDRKLLGTFEIGGRAWGEQLMAWWWAAALGAAVIVLAGFLLLMMRRRNDALVREIVVGYGSQVDYSLGGGPSMAVAKLRRFKSGRLDIERLADGDPITVNGSVLDGRRRIRQSDRVIIAGKPLKLI